LIQDGQIKALESDFLPDPQPPTPVEQAATLYRRALRAMPNHAASLNSLGDLIHAGKIKALGSDFLPHSQIPLIPAEQAAMLYRRALRAVPNHAASLSRLGNLIQDGQITALESDFLLHSQISPIPAEQAATLYRRALRAVPNDTPSLSHLGFLIETRQIQALPGDFPNQPMPNTSTEQAISLYARALMLAPKSKLPRFYLGRLLATQPQSLLEEQQIHPLPYDPNATTRSRMAIGNLLDNTPSSITLSSIFSNKKRSTEGDLKDTDPLAYPRKRPKSSQ
jgi:tetratricopeptide (TPR) repeat protein